VKGLLVICALAALGCSPQPPKYFTLISSGEVPGVRILGAGHQRRLCNDSTLGNAPLPDISELVRLMLADFPGANIVLGISMTTRGGDSLCTVATGDVGRIE
jgi:hypothetical protein